MKNNNDLHGNRVVHGDSQGQTGTEQSQSFGEARAAKKEQEKKSAQEGVQKAGKTAGAAVGAYFGGAAGAKVGAKVGDAIGKSKIGQQLGKNLAKNPLTRDFSGGPVPKMLSSQSREPRFDPCLGNEDSVYGN